MLRILQPMLACLLLLPGCVRTLTQEKPTPDAVVDDGAARDQRVDGSIPDVSGGDLAPVDLTVDVALSDAPGVDLAPDTAPLDLPWPDAPLDTDGDGVVDSKDNCPEHKNPTQTDGDGDTVGDACDNCPKDKNTTQADTDGDTVGNACDNCIQDNNPNQANLDKDAFGDVCDDDKDGDTIPNHRDPAPADADTVYYYKEAKAFGTDLETLGTWTLVGNDNLCQQTVDGTLAITRLKSTLLPKTDYVAETRFDVAGVNATMIGFPYAGITWRATTITGAFKDMYACAVDFKNWRLVLIKYYSGSGGGESIYAYSPNNSVKSAPYYRLRVSTVGSGHTCQLVDTSTSVSMTNTYHSGGTVGFVTNGVKACFGYLTVVAP